MNIYDALIKRKSTRAFLDKEVSMDKVERILKYARYAPSGTNIQPWQVAVVSGERKKQITTQLQDAFEQGIKGKMDYQYYPLYWTSPYKERRKACGLKLYQTLNIEREDKEKQRAHWIRNYNAFDAPVILFFFMDKILETGSFLDYGMFIQSVMLGAIEEGLATCPQAALGEYPKIVKQALGYPEDCILICGMALGYEDNDAKINSYRLGREELDSFVQYYK